VEDLLIGPPEMQRVFEADCVLYFSPSWKACVPVDDSSDQMKGGMRKMIAFNKSVMCDFTLEDPLKLQATAFTIISKKNTKSRR
jgi:hypothetical protein